MRTRVAVKRFHPEQDHASSLQEYHVEVEQTAMVLDALFKIRHEQDGTLAFRSACRSAICGSCTMEINGFVRLACRTPVAKLVEDAGGVTVKPMPNFRVVKDLVVEMEPFWAKVETVTPWLRPAAGVPQTPASLEAFEHVDACIMCGACLAACQSFEVSPGFLGPAALAKAYRFVADPRDGSRRSRVEALITPDGIWDCVRCNFCVEVCPKDVQPMEAIIRLRREAIKEGFVESLGSRHILSFLSIVRREGKLNEGMMPLLMLWRAPRRLLSVLPIGVRMWLKGKVPFPVKWPIRGIRAIRKIFKERARLRRGK